MRIEFSFDDGHISDLKAARLLRQYGFKGTFYICGVQVPHTIQMSLQEVQQLLNMGMEIGGHTNTHPMDMKLLSDEDLKFELVNERGGMMHIFKIPMKKFCYPRGRHDERVRQAVKDAGYEEARTTLVLHTDYPIDPYQTPTTIHMFQRDEYGGRDWLLVAKEQFGIAKAKDGYFHLWGHTAELDRQNDWWKFEELLAFIKQNI